MPSGRETASHLTGFHISANQGQSAGLMVGSHYHQCPAILFGKLKHLAYGLVEVQHLLHDILHVIVVSAAIYFRLLHHQEEPFFVIIQYIERHSGSPLQLITPLTDSALFQETGQLTLFHFLNLGDRVKHLVSLLPQFIQKVATIFSVSEMFYSSSNKKVRTGIHKIGSYLRHHLPAGLMR